MVAPFTVIIMDGHIILIAITIAIMIAILIAGGDTMEDGNHTR